MPRSLQLAILLLLSFALVHASLSRAASAPAPAAGTSVLSSLLGIDSEDETVLLQYRLRSTDEEWSIIYPKLQRIADLRASVYASGALPASAPADTGMRRALNSPIGGTSMDVPTLVGSNRWTQRSNPFDPARAPGAAGTGTGVITRAVNRSVGRTFKLGQGNSVQILLNELQTLLDDQDTSDKQLFEKLTIIRTARAKAARDLDAARKDLLPLLTTDQHALLMTLGYMD